jgi:Uma2 family endonuclease
MVTTRHLTIEEFEQLPDDGFRYELADAELVRMAPTGEAHGDSGRQLIWLIESFIRPRRIEKLFVETSFVLSERHRTVRQPDIAFVRAERLDPNRDRQRSVHLVPDLAIEVVSPSDRRSAVIAKANEYLRYGVQMVWIVDPPSRTVTVMQADGLVLTLRGSDVLDGGDLLPGLRIPLRDIFLLQEQ